ENSVALAVSCSSCEVSAGLARILPGYSCGLCGGGGKGNDRTEGGDHDGSNRRAKERREEARESPCHWRVAYFYLRPVSPLRIAAQDVGGEPRVDLHDLLRPLQGRSGETR